MKRYALLVTESQVADLLYVSDDMADQYKDQAEEEKQGGRPYVDRPSAEFLTGVSSTLESLLSTLRELPEITENVVLLDADTKGHYLCVLADYHTYLAGFIGDKIDDRFPRKEIEDDFYTLYLIGNIEGRLLYDGITQKDVELLDDWDEFLQGMKKEAEEQEKVTVLDLDKWFSCPFCGKSHTGEELQYPIASGMLYVCPYCGCILDEKEVERQLGKAE